MCLPAWLHEIEHEPDKNLGAFIKNGIAQGFNIVDTDHQICGYDCKNYSTVLTEEPLEYVNSLIKEEIKSGKLLLVVDKHICIHSLGAVDKADGSYRPITDCHRPVGASINCYMQQTAQKFKYINLDMVSDAMTKNCWMASVNISYAYRSIQVNPDHRTYQGIRWTRAGGGALSCRHPPMFWYQLCTLYFSNY